MKNLMFILFVLITCSLYSQEFCVATYNVRNQNSWDSINGNAWSQRCPYICEQINFEQPAVFGSQEVLHGQLMDMLKLLKLVNECLEKQDKKTIEDYFNCTIDDDGKGFDMDYYIDEFLVFIETFEEPILNKNTKFIYTFRL